MYANITLPLNKYSESFLSKMYLKENESQDSSCFYSSINRYILSSDGKESIFTTWLQIALGYPCKKLCSEISQEGN